MMDRVMGSDSGHLGRIHWQLQGARIMKSTREKITLNFRGIRYKTYASTLQAFPGTKLSRLTGPQEASTEFDYDPNTGEFFFDRDTRVFEEVLNYCRTKHLHCPQYICKSVIEEELAFWEISEAALAPCCWQRLSDMESQQEDLALWDDSKDEDDQALLAQVGRGNNSCRAQWQPRIWTLFEKPFSSGSAKILAAISLVFNIGICILFIKKADVEIEFFVYGHEYNSTDTVLNEIHKYFPYLIPLEFFCVLWFLFEFSVRLTFCPNKKKFLTSPLNIADFISLFPIFIELCTHGQAWLGFVRALYTLKLLKILKLIEIPLMFQVLSYTSRSVFREIFIFMIIFIFESLFFGIVMFYTEVLYPVPESYFESISSCIWWAVITLTTVGYGDSYPITEFSQVIAACAALCGVLTIVIPIPIFLIKFKGYYDAAVIKERRKRKMEQAAMLSS
ncbi:potassium voltage-gated channel subfamily C member 1-like isoform X1 [Podarcis raffonei]|uniref:potassium voltage-gated channel subfamily C member 1-like isoform X1 n=2 Tax=Podarcis raffonei TaxID=65483 RepID=UPI0023298716|nr:potassium voltage-gated channel subfamily C member 1-like isoform X1 [Podarcis raffonei]